MPLFQEEIRAVPGGFEWKDVALSPTVQHAAPAELTPSDILAAAEGAYSAGSQTYRGECLPTWNPNAMAPTPVRLPMYQHPIGREGGIGAGRDKQKAARQQSRAVRAD